jgi:hypothetical protein
MVAFVWMSGHLDVWISRCPDISRHIRMVAFAGCPDIWMSGYPDVRTTCPDISVPTPVPTVLTPVLTPLICQMLERSNT